ncbi:MAG: 2-amino-4-hydroxy-6-hydroxymethyldihydropteridine diphosphokinase [Sphingobacterium sp.]|jgi:2-amino-4-hydroxy-6-hydroxymethyldihydropteridine diphosphokinase|uniref:2-amino-4-hydroxy-6- hydroxymethyldihydropteridine diphosphokinase n=1 Tax=unclassified Sphingobacterium TaxID=2609468 RepID=UPI0028465706|nr:2-amino-4-hydroxy-6-hydroxymethyldihydropteridine diphosphokinase [Sphingobacterium sp.]MDR3007807.1 2-amino-4-hydroxy-6-hydroxymethyldihydropteridine diphosphokinase [Sphingobacterium sp.]
MNKIYILLGTNLGDRFQQLDLARKQLELRLGAIIEVSSIYETAAWGVEDQPTFLNQALIITTDLQATDCLEITQSIEQELGRIRIKKWGERVIDIDLIYFNQDIIDLPTLRIPHPFIAERRFVLAPLVEIAPDYIHPLYKKNNVYLLDKCKDDLPVKKISNDEPYRH